MLGVVLLHGGASDTYVRHYPIWAKCFDRIVTVSPADDPFPGSVTLGQSCHHGTGSIERMKLAVALAASADRAAVLEYDTLCWNLQALDPQGAILCSRVFENGDPAFSAPCFGHSPWVARRETWLRLLRHADDAQHGFPDRWLATAAYRAGIGFLGLPFSFSNDSGWTEDVICDAVDHRQSGAFAIHGFKGQEIFDRLTA